MRGRERGAEGLPPDFGAERRRQAAAIEAWSGLRAGRRVPGARDLDPRHKAGLLWLDRDRRDVRCHAVGNDRDGSRALVAAITGEADALAEAAEPLQFALEGTVDGVAWRWTGILLPYGDDVGRIVAVDMIFAATRLADDAVAASVAAAMEMAGAAPLAAAMINLPMPETPDPAPPCIAHRLASARIRAELAGVGRPERHLSLHAALGGAFDLLLATRPAPMDAPQHDEARHAARIGEIIRLVFGEEWSRQDRAMLADVLARAVRLGVGSGGLAALLDACPGGAAAMAAAEHRGRIDHGARTWPDTRPILTPLDEVMHALLARRAARRTTHVAGPRRIAA